MSLDIIELEQSKGLLRVLTAADISTESLWLYYFSIGGSVSEYEVEAYVQGIFSLPELERDLLALAANELSDTLSWPRAPFADELPGARKQRRETGPA
ncbi:hypothetical protein AB0N65_18090 [Paenarthrobacter sp. NPDC089322]|uniref:hypothetical protein n=1 Tax=Paenarthrobacter sp. NPDC089322 TaxID=3155065 RepID=UPI00343A82CC